MPFSSFFTTRSEKEHKRRGCEGMNLHFFTAPFYFSSSFLRLRGKIKRKFRNEERP